MRPPIIISDRPTVALIPRPGIEIRVTRATLEDLRQALAGRYLAQITEYTSRRLEEDHGISLQPTPEGPPYILDSGHQITILTPPFSLIEIYLTEVTYP